MKYSQTMMLALLLGLVCASAQADSTVDQSLTLSNLLSGDGFISGTMDAFNPPILTAQTFTAGETGALTGVSVLIVEPQGVPTPIADVQISIYSTAGGAPTGSPLFSTVLNVSNSGGAVGGAAVLLGLSNIIATPGVFVDSGQTYAIGVQAVNVVPHTCCELYQLGLYPADGRDPYQGGAWLVWTGTSWRPVSTSPPGDAFFETYVDTSVTSAPEPNSLFLLASGGLMLAGLAFLKISGAATIVKNKRGEVV